MDMRGLSTFIAEIRKASSNPDGEKECVSKELAKIRAKFRESKDLSGYDRKKYICKLLYMFMLGYEIDFGHMEALRLLSGTRYSEKHIGYLACTILLHESHELLTLITNQVKMDLNSGKEFYQCLALTAIANLGGTEFAEAMAHDVQKLVIAADTRSNVRKKAVLTLLRLFRKYSDMVQPEVIVAPILELLATPDFGVVNCALSLLLGLLNKCDAAMFEGSTQKCMRVLSRIVLGKETSTDYVYFGVPAPWVQMKALRVLQHYPPLSDPAQHTQMMNILQKIIAASEKLLKDASITVNKSSRGMVNRSNAMNGVLLEALSLAMHYDCDSELLASTASILGRFVNEKKDTNMRYLGLSLLSRLSFCQSINFHESVREHQSTIINSLRDQDISIRRRALDLLYCMCDTNNASDIVGEMLEYLPHADHQIREDLVLKIAILSEKYSMDQGWYVSVILNILTQAGDYVGEDVWHRLCQIVTNTPSLQKQASEMVFTAVNPVTADETLVKVASYVLGEYGDSISRNPDSAPNAQFQALQNKFLLVTPGTRSLILTCYLKMFNMYPNQALREKIRKVFADCRSHLDPELQQRAQEYYILCTEHESILPSIIDAMLPFEMRNNTVLAAVQNKMKGTTDKDVWQKKVVQKALEDAANTGATSVKHEEAPPLLPDDILKGNEVVESKGGLDNMDDLFSSSAPAAPVKPAPSMVQPVPQAAAPSAPSSSALDMDFFSSGPSVVAPAAKKPEHPAAVPVAVAPPAPSPVVAGGGGLLDDIFGSTGTGSQLPIGEYNNAKALSEVETRKRTACASRQGVLYEDDRIQIGCLSEYSGFNGRLTIFYGNKSAVAIENFTTALQHTPQNLQAQLQNISNRIEAKQQMQQQVALLCGGPFGDDDAPIVKISYLCGGLTSNFSFPLPVVTARFSEPNVEAVNNKQAFAQQWKNMAGDPIVLQGCSRNLEHHALEQVLTGVLKMTLVPSEDGNPNSVTAACLFSITGAQGVQRSPVLLNMELNATSAMVRLTVKAANPYVQHGYVHLLKLLFGSTH